MSESPRYMSVSFSCSPFVSVPHTYDTAGQYLCKRSSSAIADIEWRHLCMYNKETILILATTICEGVHGAIALKPTLELSSVRICWKSDCTFDKVIPEILSLVIGLDR